MADLESSGQGGSSSPSDAEKRPVAWIKWLALSGVVIGLAVLSTVDLGKSLREFLKEHWSEVSRWKEENPWLLGGGFFLAYVAAVGLSLPIAVPLSLTAGALYGPWYGTLFVSFASTAGATLAFLASRYLFRDVVQRRFGHRLQALNHGVETDGAYYLLSLRLQPVVPFWLINLGMGLTPMRVGTFWVVSQIGMLPGTFIYVYLGASAKESAETNKVWPLLLALALLGLVPVTIRLLFRWIKRRKSSDRERV
jgi:uncharacterized membrane protein YdjX (TVP38/TMEM64 family)